MSSTPKPSTSTDQISRKFCDWHIQRKEVDDNLEKARKTMIESVEEDFNTSKNRVELLQEDLDKQKAEANDLAEKLVQYHILQHDAESNKQLYDGLLQKLKEATITVGLHSDNIRVVDPALVPASPLASAEGSKHSIRLSRRSRRRRRDSPCSANISTTP